MKMTMQQFWIFGYGSLMWRPGFDFLEQRPGTIRGYHRSLCVLSHVHRGTPERPGLVLGLDRGGACRGNLFRVAPDRWAETVAYLRAREQVTMVYREVETMATTPDGPVPALTYAVDRRHHQYAGTLGHDRLVRLILQGAGQSGRCIDYVFNTVAHLRELGIHDENLERLAADPELQAAIAAGSAV
jgi:cation transport protein ChaC